MPWPVEPLVPEILPVAMESLPEMDFRLRGAFQLPQAFPLLAGFSFPAQFQLSRELLLVEV